MAREAKRPAAGPRWRVWLGAAGLGVLCVSTAIAGLKVHEFALTDPQFWLSRDNRSALTIEGLGHASRIKVMRVFAADFGHSIFSVPLAERRRRLLAIDWVRDASVSRVWPDRLVVRIHERVPVAFVALRTGVLLIDADGVLLEVPPAANFAYPVLSGMRDDDTEERRRERVHCLIRLEEDLGDRAGDVSEVNATDPDNLRMVARVDNGAAELIMGDDNFGARYRNFVKHYPEIHKRSPGARTFDLRLADRIAAEE